VEVKDVKLDNTPNHIAEDIKSVQIVETPKVLAEIKAADEPSKPVDPTVVQKLETNPEPPTIVPSSHVVADVPVVAPVVKISKEGGAVGDGMIGGGEPNVMIDTEPSVHFTPYDTVFDETSQGISHIRYSPKDGDGGNDGYDAPPRLSFGTTSNAIVADDAEDLEPVAAPVSVEMDVDAPLGSTGDFEELS
jgi:hypothetical protein